MNLPFLVLLASVELVDPFFGTGETTSAPSEGMSRGWNWEKAQSGNTHPGAVLPLVFSFATRVARPIALSMLKASEELGYSPNNYPLCKRPPHNDGQSQRAIYPSEIVFNGKRLDEPWLAVDELKKGGKLVFKMSETTTAGSPVPNWL